ncbi:hypothetical protein HOY82DRAFT_581337 [Tuber indicum]|nr:hypothetical protein HOY82DRAFT_581337 [Tuber indicum]
MGPLENPLKFKKALAAVIEEEEEQARIPSISIPQQPLTSFGHSILYLFPLAGRVIKIKNHLSILVQSSNLDSRAQGPTVLDRSVKVSCPEAIQDNANRKKEHPRGASGIESQAQEIPPDQEFHGCGRSTSRHSGGQASRKDNPGDPAGDPEDYPPPSLYPAPTATATEHASAAIPSAALKHGIQQHQMFGYHQFLLHHIDPPALQPGHQNGGDDRSGGCLRTERRTKRQTPAHSELGLRVICSFGSKGAHFLREARDGAPGGGRAYGEDYDPRGVVRQDGDKDSDHDRYHHNRDHRDTPPGREGIRRISGAPEAPAEPDARGEREAAARVSPEPPMGQRRSNPARELPLQAPSVCTARARKCVNMFRYLAFSPSCSMSCSISCFGLSSSTFSHYSHSRLFGFRGDLGFSKSDIRRCRRKRKGKVIRNLPRLWKAPPLGLDDFLRVGLSISRTAIFDHPDHTSPNIPWSPGWRTITSACARRRTQDEGVAPPVALPLPPELLDGRIFLCTILVTKISHITVSTLVQFFLSFVSYLEGWEGVVFGDRVNGAAEEDDDDGVITESKFVFLLILKHAITQIVTVTRGANYTTKGSGSGLRRR